MMRINILQKNSFLIKTALIMGGLFFMLYFINIRPALSSFYVIKGANENKKIQTGFYRQDKVLTDFQKGVNLGTFGYAENNMWVGDYALSLFNNRTRVFSDDMKAVFNLAIRGINKTVEANPKDARFRAMLGMLYLKYTEYDASVAVLSKKAFEETLAISPNRPDVLFLLSKAEFAAGNNEKSIAVLKQAIALAPDSAEFRVGLIMYYFVNGDVAQAKDAVEQAKKLFGGHFQVVSHIEKILVAYEKYGLYNEMPPFYYDAMKIEPTNYQWPFGLMNVYLKLGDKEKASEMAKKAVSLSPSLRESLKDLL